MANTKNSYIQYDDNYSFEKLRQEIDTFLNTASRKSNITKNGDTTITDKSGVQNYTYKAGGTIKNYSTSLSQTQNQNISKEMAVGLNIIRDILANNYMSVGNNTAEKSNILNISEVTNSSYNIIPALSDYFTIVNYWNQGTESNHRCNGACTGFCTGSCAQENTSGSGCNNNSCKAQATNTGGFCSSCSGYCISGCTSCSNSCGAGCYSDCSGHGCKSNCSGICVGCTGCSTVCGITCTTACTGTNG